MSEEYICHEFCKAKNKKGANGRLICLDDLHGLLYLGNTLNGMYNLNERYMMWAEHSLGLRDFTSIEEIFKAEGVDAATQEFKEQLRDRILEELA